MSNEIDIILEYTIYFIKVYLEHNFSYVLTQQIITFNFLSIGYYFSTIIGLYF